MLLMMHHDEDAEVSLTGVLALKAPGWSTTYRTFRVEPASASALKVGVNRLAVHCKQVAGGQYIDVGVLALEEAAAR